MENYYNSPLKRLYNLLRPDSREIRNIYIYAILGGAITLSLPLGIQAIISFIQGGAVSTSWIVLVVIVALGVALAGIIQVNQLRVTENLQQKVFVRAAFDFVYSIPRVKMDVMIKKHAPELVNRFFDVLTIQKGLSKLLLDFSSAVIQVFFGLLLLSLYHNVFIGFSLVLVTLIFLFFRYTSKRGLETSIEESDYKYKIAHWIQELARSAKTFRMNKSMQLPLEKLNAYSESYINAREGHFKVLRLQYSLMIVFKVVVVLGLLLVGGFLVIEQQMNIGQFVASEIVILLIINSTEKMMLSFETIYDVFTGLEKISKVLELPLENENSSVEAPEDIKTLTLQHVSLSYGSTKIFSDFNITLERPEALLITGNSAFARQSFLNVLAGVETRVKGSVLLNEMPLQQYSLGSYREKVGYEYYQDRLFEGDLKTNIFLTNEVPEKQLRLLMEMVNLKHWFEYLPQGMNTKILPGGEGLCSDVIDKLLLARTLVKGHQIILLENPLKGISVQERSEILNRIIALNEHIIVVSADESMFSEVDFNETIILK